MYKNYFLFQNISTVIGMGNLDNNTLGKIDAHEEEISCLAINVHGTLIASSSSKGTSIRIWNIVFKIMVCELRFGPNIATLYWYVIDFHFISYNINLTYYELRTT